MVIDAWSKRILGWAFSASLETAFVVQALKMAIRRRSGRCAPGLILHSDRRVQYASERFRAELAAHGIVASMSRRGNCYDNARAEAFFSTLKVELVYRCDFIDHDHAPHAVFEWIEAFYNLRRPRSFNPSLRSASGLPPRGIAKPTSFRHINQPSGLTLSLAPIPRPRHWHERQ